MVTPVSTPYTSTSNKTTGNDSLAGGLESNYQDFLKLLTVQLQNQDPTAPADTNQLTQQIATLSQVEQQITTNKNLQQLINLFGMTQLNSVVGYIGKQVDAVGNQGIVYGGAGAFAYDLPPGATQATVTIMSPSGQTVFSSAGTTFAGRNEVYWNGKNSITGETMPDGIYTFKVTAKDANGKELEVTTLTTGIATAVDTKNGNTNVMLGDIEVPLSAVRSVRNPPGA